MPANPSHTPTPWSIYQGENGPIAIVSGEEQPGDRRIIARVDSPSVTLPLDTQVANAAHIVRCVNEREGLITALERAIGTIQIWHSMKMGGIPSQQEYLWKVYQTSPEMKYLNSVLNAAKREGS